MRQFHPAVALNATRTTAYAGLHSQGLSPPFDEIEDNAWSSGPSAIEKLYIIGTSPMPVARSGCMTLRSAGTSACLPDLQATEELPRVEVAWSCDAVSGMLHDIRRRTGWSWDQIAHAVGKSRQAVHGWTVGKNISRESHRRLADLHATVSYVDRGNQEANRNSFAEPTADGRTVLELVMSGKFEAVRGLLGRGNAMPPAKLPAVEVGRLSAPGEPEVDLILARPPVLVPVELD